MEMTTTQKGQTAFDVILQKYGSLDGGIAFLLEDNTISNELPLGDVHIEGQTLKIRATIIDQSIVDYHSNKILTTY